MYARFTLNVSKCRPPIILGLYVYYELYGLLPETAQKEAIP